IADPTTMIMAAVRARNQPGPSLRVLMAQAPSSRVTTGGTARGILLDAPQPGRHLLRRVPDSGFPIPNSGFPIQIPDSSSTYADGVLGGLLGGPGHWLSGSRSEGRCSPVSPDEPLAAAPPGQQVVRATHGSSCPVSQLRNSYFYCLASLTKPNLLCDTLFR